MKSMLLSAFAIVALVSSGCALNSGSTNACGESTKAECMVMSGDCGCNSSERRTLTPTYKLFDNRGMGLRMADRGSACNKRGCNRGGCGSAAGSCGGGGGNAGGCAASAGCGCDTSGGSTFVSMGDGGCGCSGGSSTVSASMGDGGCGCGCGETMIEPSMGDCGCGETTSYDVGGGYGDIQPVAYDQLPGQGVVAKAAGGSPFSCLFGKCRLGGAKAAVAAPAIVAAPSFAAPSFGGCGVRGCGVGNQRCQGCLAKLAGARGGFGGGQPYGGAIPHTAQGPGAGTGAAPSYAYPYYTTRGPRDFLMKKPPSIGY